MSDYVVAVDVGGTSMKGGIVTGSGEIAATGRRPTGAEGGPAGVVAAIRSFVGDLADRGAAALGTGPAAVGIAVPGLVDDATATALYAANLGWRDVPATDLVPLDVPVLLGHDVRTGGLAESVLGAGRELSDFLFLPIGTGIAGAMIIGGAPYGGTSGWGGEIGHIPVFPDGEACACGQIGCLETYASASAVGRRYSARAGASATAEQVAALTADGDPVAAEVWEEAVEALSLALATYTLLLDPSAIVLGGGLAEAGPLLSDPLAVRLAKRLAFREAPPLRRAVLGVGAGMLGAALLGWRAAGVPDAGASWSPDVPRTPVVS
ncbi:ROK family protein [Planomonospora venezuelensis]|uniref:Glucokinase n=1 Tax=Planomonospora venezuelensis TaxID=1999 RepID=A0A841D5P8_PLAVE|nr:ROK family protein [Planomonospora venezuelensis]MBB5965200.1 glucokinase [Planomonospora venezuelensis]GIN00279.1 sugar kinase [Planomonospora venezuelensis]